MASDPNSSSRKVKFHPKQPSRRLEKPSLQPKCEVAIEEDVVDERKKELLRKKVDDHLTGHRPQTQKKSPIEVVFTRDPASSSSLRTFGKQNKGDCGLDSKQETLDLPPVDCNTSYDKSKKEADDIDVRSLKSSSDKTKKKEYNEPWDYENSFYPITLPLRRPNSGDPEILNEEEFGEKAFSMEYDENARNVASELGLQPEDESDEEKMIFIQLPRKLPMHKQTLRPPGGSVAGSSVSGGSATLSNRTSGDLEFLPPTGHMGKFLVHKSGAVKWKMGGHLFDVSPGVACNIPQDYVSMNKAERHCATLGNIEELRAIVTLDDDSLFNA